MGTNENEPRCKSLANKTTAPKSKTKKKPINDKRKQQCGNHDALCSIPTKPQDRGGER